MAAVTLVPFEPDRHMPLVAEWLRQPHAAPWWGDADTTLAEIAAHPVATEAIIEADGEPVGFVVWQTPTRAELIEAGLDDLPADLVDIDIMIGAPSDSGAALGRKRCGNCSRDFSVKAWRRSAWVRPPPIGVR